MSKKISKKITDVSGEQWAFEGYDELLAFLKEEASYWSVARERFKDIRNNQKHVYIRNSNQLDGIYNELDSWKDQIENWDENTLQQKFRRVSQFDQIQTFWLWSGHPYISIYLDCHEKYGYSCANSFIDFIVYRKISNPNDYPSFTGTLLAYEFLHQDSELTKRRNGEKASFTQLRNRLDKTTTEPLAKVLNLDNFGQKALV